MNLTNVRALDAADPLAAKYDEFELPPGVIYLDGNSLGPVPRCVKKHIEGVVSQQWGCDLIASWNKHGWIELPTRIGEKIAPLLGAAEGQVICCDSISVNLFKLLSSALTMNSPRRVVLSQRDNFPTDLYTAEGLADLLGSKRCELRQVSAERLTEALDESVAVLMLTHVNFRSGAMHDMRALTQLAHEKGILVLWDLAHSAGALALDLDHDKVDFAVGCGYKYLNGGPGAPAFIYVAKRHQGSAQQPLSGWMGHQAPFDFAGGYAAAPGIKRFMSGTPPILSMAALDAALDVFSDVDMAAVRAKSISLSELFLSAMQDYPALTSLECISPVDAAHRGSQLAFRHSDAFAISQALIENKTVADFRAPDVVRFGFSPLYLRFEDVREAVSRLNTVVESGAYKLEKYQLRQLVT